MGRPRNKARPGRAMCCSHFPLGVTVENSVHLTKKRSVGKQANSETELVLRFVLELCHADGSRYPLSYLCHGH